MQKAHKYSSYGLIENLVRSDTKQNKNKEKAYSRIDEIYKSEDFASLFASLSPEEDFAETLKLAVLHEAGLTDLKASVNGDVTDVIATLDAAKTGLNDKATCLMQYLVPGDLP